MKLYIPVLLILLTSLFSCSRKSFWPEEKDPERIAAIVIEDLLSRDDFMMYHTPGVHAVHYAEVATAFGAAKLAGMQNDEQTLSLLSGRYMKVIEDSMVNTANHVDANVYGILPLELYMQGEGDIFCHQGMELADGQWEEPLADGLSNQSRFWIDDVYMIGCLQIQAYRATGKTVYLDRAAIEIAVYLEKLQKPNGLFYHGENAPFYWGRGNGWVAAGLAEVISELPDNHPQYPVILEGYTRMMNALLKYQADDGMWRQLIDVDTAWKETSCSGMFGYSMSVGVKKGILPANRFKPAYEKTWLALCDYISPDGKIRDVCVGTGQSLDVNYYLTRPTVKGDFHGQAPLLWFATSLLKE